MDAVRGVAHAIAGGVGHGGLGDVHPQPEHGAHAAAMRAVAAGVGAELVVLERQRKARLGDLDAAELDPARRLALAGRLPAIARDRGAAAGPRVKHVPDEWPPRARIDALDRDAEPPAPAGDCTIREGGRQRLDDGLGDLLRAVIGGERHRSRRIRPHDRPLLATTSTGRKVPEFFGVRGSMRYAKAIWTAD